MAVDVCCHVSGISAASLSEALLEGTDSGCRDIQIILTIHYPLMLGDFLTACVFYLKKDKDSFVTVESNSVLQPFGQNLCTLFKGGFYLQNGTIGALAKKNQKRA